MVYRLASFSEDGNDDGSKICSSIGFFLGDFTQETDVP